MIECSKRISKVISGGQTGVDQAGLLAAAECNIRTGGYAPAGWRTDEGPAPWLADYGLICHPSREYPPRTKMNVCHGSLTVILGDHNSAGCKLTKKYCNMYTRPYHLVPKMDERDFDETVAWLLKWTTAGQHLGGELTINVAGNRERSFPGIHEQATHFLTKVFTKVNSTPYDNDDIPSRKSVADFF